MGSHSRVNRASKLEASSHQEVKPHAGSSLPPRAVSCDNQESGINFLSLRAVSLVYPIPLLFSTEMSTLVLVSLRPGSLVCSFLVILTSKTSTPGPSGDYFLARWRYLCYILVPGGRGQSLRRVGMYGRREATDRHSFVILIRQESTDDDKGRKDRELPRRTCHRAADTSPSFRPHPRSLA